MALSVLWAEPEVNPLNKKARSIPILNPLCLYGRVFFFSWFGFFIAFWSWYAFPPLLHDVIAADLGMSTNEIAISNIIALTATLLVRLVAGTCCDRFGPRWTFAGCLLIGAIPTFLSGTAYTVAELYALRFFIGILGGSFVPCQVWTTAFFDKNIVGTANSLTAGFGNAGGGVTYFVMPAVYTALVGDGLSDDKAWRVAYIVPGILICTVATGLLLCCPDTPTGKWSERMNTTENNLRNASTSGAALDGHEKEEKSSGTSSPTEEKKGGTQSPSVDPEIQHGQIQDLDLARGEVVRDPSFKEIIMVMSSPQTLVTGACYFCTFGAELSINSILGTYFGTNFPNLGLTGAGNWAAMFGLMNAICRPLGGVVSDFAYRRTKSVWAKKALLHTYSIIAGAFFVALGATNPMQLGTFVGLINIGAAFFMEGANGLNYSLVPHVHPYANGIVSGFTGACGNLGGIIFAIIFKYEMDYARSIWIIGVITIAINVAVSWIPPIPKGQVVGH